MCIDARKQNITRNTHIHKNWTSEPHIEKIESLQQQAQQILKLVQSKFKRQENNKESMENKKICFASLEKTSKDTTISNWAEQKQSKDEHRTERYEPTQESTFLNDRNRKSNSNSTMETTSQRQQTKK